MASRRREQILFNIAILELKKDELYKEYFHLSMKLKVEGVKEEDTQKFKQELEDVQEDISDLKKDIAMLEERLNQFTEEEEDIEPEEEGHDYDPTEEVFTAGDY